MMQFLDKESRRDELAIKYYGSEYSKLCGFEKRAVDSILKGGEDAKDK